MSHGNSVLLTHEFLPYVRYLLENRPESVRDMLTETSRYDSPELAGLLVGGDKARARKVLGYSSDRLPRDVRVRLVQLLPRETLCQLAAPKGSMYQKYLALEHPEVASLLSASARKHLVLNQDMRIRYRVAANPSFSRDERVEALCGYRSRGGPALNLDHTPYSWEWETLLPFSDGELGRLVTSASPTVLKVVFGSLWDLRSEFCHPRFVELAKLFVKSCSNPRLSSELQKNRFDVFWKHMWFGKGFLSPVNYLKGRAGNHISMMNKVRADLFQGELPLNGTGDGLGTFVDLLEANDVSDPLDVDWERAWTKHATSLVHSDHLGWVVSLSELLVKNPFLGSVEDLRDRVLRSVVTVAQSHRRSVYRYNPAEVLKLGALFERPITRGELLDLVFADDWSQGYYKDMFTIAAKFDAVDRLWDIVPAKHMVKHIETIGYERWVSYCRNHVPQDQWNMLYHTAQTSSCPLPDLLNMLR